VQAGQRLDDRGLGAVAASRSKSPSAPAMRDAMVSDSSRRLAHERASFTYDLTNAKLSTTVTTVLKNLRAARNTSDGLLKSRTRFISKTGATQRIM